MIITLSNKTNSKIKFRFVMHNPQFRSTLIGRYIMLPINDGIYKIVELT
jgi:hypothetical protein